MSRLRVSFQIAICLAFLSTSAYILAETLGLFPNPDQVRLEARITLCETLAIQSSQLINLQQPSAVETLLKSLAESHPELRSAALRRADGTVLATLGKHEQIWIPLAERRSTPEQVFVPIVMNGEEWGVLEVAFAPIRDTSGWLGWLPPSYQLIVFITAANALLFILYLRRVLYELDPQKTMPNRVRSALDTLVEGLLVLDTQGRIVMANRAFAHLTNRNIDSLQGLKASEIPWLAESSVVPPWEDVLRTGYERTGVPLGLNEKNAEERAFVVNAAPILDGNGVKRGVLASFGDVTPLEHKKRELLNMLNIVQASREKISRQNEELQYLATRDPLTGCLNRRSFFEQFESHWNTSRDKHSELSCVMVDVDHFKSINDRFGHSTGDEVLKQVASALLSAISHSGLVCRYGGEEFCVLLPGCSVDIAVEAAERLREAIGALQFNGFQVTASLGTSSNQLGAESAQGMLEEADKCLYYAKRNGRNRVASWNKIPHDIVVDQSQLKRKNNDEPDLTLVPYTAVTALLAALAYRDPETAAHSQRVADLAVATARGMLTARDAYCLEIAALLHDIGKVGVPDAILLKPAALTPQEWEIMRLGKRIGVEIVNASFQSPSLLEMVGFHHCPFGGSLDAPQLPKGEKIPLGSRIIAICDAYDSMTSDRVYRAGRSSAAACEELRKMAGTQFDPELVERFVAIIADREERPSRSATMAPEVLLNLCQQTERLAKAVDEQDLDTLRAIAGHLEATAAKHGANSIQFTAAQLIRLAAEEPDLLSMVHLIHEIIDLSLAAQRSVLQPAKSMTVQRLPTLNEAAL